jgi:hypothetical protein
MKEDGGKYILAANKGIRWALSHLNENGSFMGSESMLLGHYKALQTLATAGFVREAELIAAFLRSYFPENGDFNCLSGDPRPASTANYRNSWLCWGAHTIGAYELSIRGGKFLELAQNKANGGLPARCEKETSDQNVDWGTTACAIIAFLAIGNLTSAIKAGECLREMLDQQPEPETSLYLCKRWTGEWVISFPPGEAMRFLVQFGKPNQIYWYFGIGMAALGKLYLATGERKWLAAAQKIFDLTEKCSPDVYQSLTSAKVGWGASVLYRITGEKRFEKTTLHVGNYLLDTQTDEGVWIRRPQFESVNDQPIPNSLDTTLERCLWLFEMARGLEKRG